MGYRTVDEWENFEFQDADIGQIHMENGHLYLELGYVTILPDNSCNRDIRKMGTNELTLQLQHVQIDRIVEEGYKLYDADGNFTGFDTELATAVCEKLGVEPEFVEINWDTKETELAAKSIDCIWNGLTLTDDREENMACTKPYVKNAQVVVVKDGTDYTSTADLIGKTVVAEAGSAGETTIQEDENLAQADYVSKSVQTDCLMEVAAGTADAAVLDLTLANAMIGEGTDYASLKIVDELNAEEYGVAFRKGSDAAEAVNAAFDELKADGTMQALAEKYSLTLAD